MQSISLTGGPLADDFFPFSETRDVADIRCGILTIRQKWEYFFKVSDSGKGIPAIPANVLPNGILAEAIGKGDPAAVKKAVDQADKLRNIIDIISLTGQEIERDIELITRGRNTIPVTESNRIVHSSSGTGKKSHIPGAQIFIEPGAVMEHCILNDTEGPIYIGENALVMEGCMIRGPFALGAGSVMKMGTKIYGATTVGPYCTIGGEIKNSVIFGNSNKAHDGYLGDSVIGEWCNIGGGTSNSNMKNNAGTIKLWNPLKNSYLDVGQKAGLFMGDYSRCAINTSFNSGTVVGVCANVFGKGLTPAYLSSFSWGYDPETEYDFEKAIRDIIQWKKLKNQTLSSGESNMLKDIFDRRNKAGNRIQDKSGKFS
jgi:UDP-N-acetylglucosamine diphosphorylase/glucosamine-1-phosphate N-acetyltransferase